LTIFSSRQRAIDFFYRVISLEFVKINMEFDPQLIFKDSLDDLDDVLVLEDTFLAPFEDITDPSNVPSESMELCGPQTANMMSESNHNIPTVVAQSVLPPMMSNSSSSREDSQSPPPIRTRDGQILSFENFQGKIDINKCVRMSLNSLNLLDADECDLPPADEAPVEKKKRPRKPNPDSELISQATEQTLRLMNLEPTSKEGKKQRRRISNQMSAQLHRERKKQYIEALEDCVRDRDVYITELEAKVRDLESKAEAMSMYVSSSSSIASTTQQSLTERTSVSVSNSHIVGDSDLDSSVVGNESPLSMSDGDENPRKRRMGSIKTGLTLFSTALLSLGLLNMNLTPNMNTNMNINTGISSVSMPPSSAPAGISFGSIADWNPFLSTDTASVDKSGSDLDDEVLHDTLAIALSSSPPTTSKSADQSLPLIKYENTKVHSYDFKIEASELWNYDSEDVLMRLYPKNTTSVPRRPSKRKGYLRMRSATDKALVPTLPSMNWMNKETPRTSTSVSTSSHVIMTKGRALLDPIFLSHPQNLKDTGMPTYTHTAPIETTNNVVQSWTKWSTDQDDRVSHSHIQESQTGRPLVTVASVPSGADGSEQNTNTPQLVMMLPASSVRWGSSWKHTDSTNNIESILHEMRQGEENDTKSTSSSSADLWVEIGCSVYKATVIQNPALISTDI
jgi:hypothetical protein